MKIRSIFLSPLTFVIFGLAASSAHAQGDWYAGAGFGSTSTDTGITAGTATLDEDDSGFKLFAGKKLNNNISIEGVYADMGEATLTGDNGDTFTIGNTIYQFIVNNGELAVEGSVIGASAVYSHNLNDAFSIHGKLGMAFWEVDATVTGSGINSSTSSDDGFDLFYGVGVDYRINDGWSVRADYEIYNIEEGDADMLSASIVKWF